MVNLFGRIQYKQTLGEPDLRARYKVKTPRPIYPSWRLQSPSSAIGMHKEYIRQNGSAIDIGTSLEPSASHTIEYPDQIRERLKRFDARSHLGIEHLANLLQRRYRVDKIGLHSTIYQRPRNRTPKTNSSYRLELEVDG
jgi:hypothetical protein